MTSINEDYILREVEKIAIVISQVLGLRGEAKLEQATNALDKGIKQLLGRQTDIVGILDSSTAAPLIGDPRLVCAYADLIQEKAQFYPDDDEKYISLIKRSDELREEANKIHYKRGI